MGCRIVVTRRPEQSGPFTSALRSVGADVKEIPLIRIAYRPRPHEVDQRLKEIGTFDWVLFTSPNAVHSLLDSDPERNRRPSGIGLTRLCAIGPGTESALRQYGLGAQFLPSEALGSAIPDGLEAYCRTIGLQGLRGQRVLFPRSNLANPRLITALQDRGAEVTELIAYETQPDRVGASRIAETLCAGEVDLLFLASPSAVRSLRSAMSDRSYEPELLPRRVGAVCIGPVTAKSLADASDHIPIHPSLIAAADQPSAECVVATTCSLWQWMRKAVGPN